MATGEQLRNEGMARSEKGASKEWKQVAHWVMRKLIASREPFSANDFNKYIDMMGEEPYSPAMGALFGTYARRGDIVRAGTTRAEKPSAHARLYPTWVAKGVLVEEDITANVVVVLRRINEAIEEVENAPITVYPRGHAEGLKMARRIINEEIDRRKKQP